MSTGVLFQVHQRARGEMAEDETGIQTRDVVDRSSVAQVVSPQVHLVMRPWVSRVRVELVLIFNFLPYLLSIAFEFKKNK